MDFIYEGYRGLIRNLNGHGYKSCTYSDWKCCDKSVILRHDIDTSPEDMVERILREKSILEDALELPIEKVSMHRHSKWTLEQDITIPGMINSYGTEYFNNMKYVFDFRMNWRENVEAIVESESYDRLHVLLQAFSCQEKKMTTTEILRKFISVAKSERYISLSENV